MLFAVVVFAQSGGGSASGGATQSGGAVSGGATQMASLMKAGSKVFANNCAVCHGANGQGGVGLKLAGFAALSSKSLVIHQILDGGGIMPSFASKLSNKQIAAVATFIRNSWGNDFGPITAQYVSLYR
jgi:mono/diheme cytochrome c family protein